MPTKTKIASKVKYEPVLKLPPLPFDAFSALRDNIAINGVLVPILVDSDGPKRRIIDGNYRKQIANELGYDCPEIVQAGTKVFRIPTANRVAKPITDKFRSFSSGLGVPCHPY